MLDDWRQANRRSHDFRSYPVMYPIRRSNGLIWERVFTHGKICHGFQFLVLVIFIKRLTKAMHHVILPWKIMEKEERYCFRWYRQISQTTIRCGFLAWSVSISIKDRVSWRLDLKYHFCNPLQLSIPPY